MRVDLRHGGNRQAVADVLGCRPAQLLDASASLAPWSPRCPRLTEGSLRDYPDRDQTSLRQAIAAIHGLPPDWVLPGNGAAELFTWAARDAAALGGRRPERPQRRGRAGARRSGAGDPPSERLSGFLPNSISF